VLVIDLIWSGKIDSDVTAAINSDVVVVMIDLKVAIDSDRMAVVNSDMGVAADSEGGAVMSLAAMASVDSEVPVGEVPVGAFIDSHREATKESDVMVVMVSDMVMKGDRV
jgi:hypothetical protein